MTDNAEMPYLPAVAALAPAFTLKALANLPATSVEYAVERKAYGDKAGFGRLLHNSLKGRAGGKLLGGVLGVATAPLYMRGIRQLSSEDPSEHRSGYANLAAAGATYAGLKGFTEDALEHRSQGLNKALTEGGRMAASKALFALPAALVLGHSVAVSRRKDNESGGSSKFVTPVVTGAALGAVLNSGERAVKDLLAGNIKGAIRGAKPRAISGAVGGALGGLISAAVAEYAMKKKEPEKTASVSSLVHAIPLIGDAVANLPEVFATHVLAKPFFGVKQRIPGTAMDLGDVYKKIPVINRLEGLTQRKQARELALGLREALAGRTDIGFRGKFFNNLIMAENRIPRELGLQLGMLLRGVPENRRAKVLESVKTFVENNPKLRATTAGNRSILAGLPGAVDMATGKTPLYGEAKTRVGRALNTARARLLYGGRGILTPGLPTLGKQDQLKTKARIMAEELPSILASKGILAATTPLGGVGAVAGGIYGTHLMFNSVKGALANTKPLQNMGAALSAEGFRNGLLNVKSTPSERRARWLYEMGGSPQAYAMSDIAEAFGASLRTKLFTDKDSVYAMSRDALRKAYKTRKNKQLIDQYKLPVLGTAAGVSLATMGSRRGTTTDKPTE